MIIAIRSIRGFVESLKVVTRGTLPGGIFAHYSNLCFSLVISEFFGLLAADQETISSND